MVCQRGSVGCQQRCCGMVQSGESFSTIVIDVQAETSTVSLLESLSLRHFSGLGVEWLSLQWPCAVSVDLVMI